MTLYTDAVSFDLGKGGGEMASIIALIQFCFDSSMAAPVCRPFWSWAAIAAVVLAGVVVLLLCRTGIRDYRRKRAADREEARRAFVDTAAIADRVWRGDALAGDPHEREDLAAEIRAHLSTALRK